MFETRKSQVFKETTSPIPSLEFRNVKFTIQQHDAKKAGLHYDYRLVIGPKAYSWASRYLLPATTKERFFIQRQPDHRAEYALWSGTIPEGEYGAGKVSVIFKSDAIIVKSSRNNIKLIIPDGQFKGTYSFIRKDDRSWLVVRNRDKSYEHAKKEHYPSKVPESMWNDGNVIASEKKDGASVVAKLNGERGIAIVSVRKSKNGDLIVKDNQVPHISYIKPPKKFDGMVIRGELYLEKHPFNVLSGILNSKSSKAVDAQNTIGEKIKLAPFDILKLPGGDSAAELTYIEKLRILEELERYLNSEHVKVPEWTTENKKEFYNNIISKGGEGVVLNHNKKHRFYKVKKDETYTLRIRDYTNGTGRLRDKGIGAFIVEDGKGRIVGKVGSGLTDEIRIEAYNNFDKFKGKLIKVKMMEPTSKSIRSPRFVGWDLEKDYPDILPF